MQRLILCMALLCSSLLQAQSQPELIKHYEAFYKQMKAQGDVQGVINGLTHLNILSPSEARQDTLAFFYMNDGKHLQALNTIGIELKATDSDLALEIKAVSLKAVGQAKLAIPHFEALFKRNPSPLVAYELAELNIQLNNLAEAKKHTQLGLGQATEDMVMPFYETNQPYQVPLKAALTYLNALITFNENKTTNMDAAIALLDDALKQAPNFNLALVSKNALLAQKTQTDPKN